MANQEQHGTQQSSHDATSGDQPLDLTQLKAPTATGGAFSFSQTGFSFGSGTTSASSSIPAQSGGFSFAPPAPATTPASAPQAPAPAPQSGGFAFAPPAPATTPASAPQAPAPAPQSGGFAFVPPPSGGSGGTQQHADPSSTSLGISRRPKYGRRHPGTTGATNSSLDFPEETTQAEQRADQKGSESKEHPNQSKQKAKGTARESGESCFTFSGGGGTVGTKVGAVATIESYAKMLENDPLLWSNRPSTQFGNSGPADGGDHLAVVDDAKDGEESIAGQTPSTRTHCCYLKPFEAIVLSLLFGKEDDDSTTKDGNGDEEEEGEGEDIRPRYDVALLVNFARKLLMPRLLWDQEPKISTIFGFPVNSWEYVTSYSQDLAASPHHQYFFSPGHHMVFSKVMSSGEFKEHHSVMRWDRAWVQRAYCSSASFAANNSAPPLGGAFARSLFLGGGFAHQQNDSDAHAPWLLAGCFGVLPPFDLCRRAMSVSTENQDSDAGKSAAQIRMCAIRGAIVGNQFDVLLALSRYFPMAITGEQHHKEFVKAIAHSDLSLSKVFSIVSPQPTVDYLCALDRGQLQHVLAEAVVRRWDVFAFFLEKLQENADGGIDVTELLTAKRTPSGFGFRNCVSPLLCLSLQCGLEQLKRCLALCDREKVDNETKLQLLAVCLNYPQEDSELVAFRYLWDTFQPLATGATRETILNAVHEEWQDDPARSNRVFKMVKFLVEEAAFPCEEVVDKFALGICSEEGVKYFHARGCNFTKLSSDAQYHLLNAALRSTTGSDPNQKQVARLQFLLEDLKIDVNAVWTRQRGGFGGGDRVTDTALWTAVVQCDVGLCRFLLEHGADLHTAPVLRGLTCLSPNTPPAKALEMAKFLVEDCGLDPVADTTESDDQNLPPFLVQFSSSLPKTAKELRRALNRYFIPFFDHCVADSVLFADHNALELIECGARCDPNWRSAEGNVSYAHLAAVTGDLEAAKAIIGSIGLEAARTDEKCTLGSLKGLVRGESDFVTALEVAVKRHHYERQDAVAFLKYFVSEVKVHGHDSPAELDMLLVAQPCPFGNISRAELSTDLANGRFVLGECAEERSGGEIEVPPAV